MFPTIPCRHLHGRSLLTAVVTTFSITVRFFIVCLRFRIPYLSLHSARVSSKKSLWSVPTRSSVGGLRSGQ